MTLFSAGIGESPSRIKLGVAVLIRDRRGWILLEKRSDCGLWGVPGGRIEPGESVETAAHREIFEETGLVIKIEKLIGVYSNPREGRILRYPDAIVHCIDVAVEARAISGTVRISNESEALVFFAFDAVPSELMPSSRAILADAKESTAGWIR